MPGAGAHYLEQAKGDVITAAAARQHQCPDGIRSEYRGFCRKARASSRRCRHQAVKKEKLQESFQ